MTESIHGKTSEGAISSSQQTDYDRFFQKDLTKPCIFIGENPGELDVRSYAYDPERWAQVSNCDVVEVENKILLSGLSNASKRERFFELNPNTPVFDKKGKHIGTAGNLGTILQDPSVFR